MHLPFGDYVFISCIFSMYQQTEISVYIHWPFCKSKCPYCDFYKEIYRNVDQKALIDEYIGALERYHELTSNRTVKSVFFGGGTPSLIAPENVAELIDFIVKKWPCRHDMEISLEANPNSDYPTMFNDLKLSGVNRLSLGVQALDENDLRFLGRTHNLKQARDCIQKVVEIFDNHSVDLIYARPHQQLSSWMQELREIIGYGLKHISLYQLTIEEGTVFWHKKVKALEETAALEMYEKTCDFLIDSGYGHYEVSNFAVKGFESSHNLTYWQGGDYIGIGKSAHGRLYLHGQHIATEYPFKHEVLSAKQRAEELIIMGLRLIQGINKKTFEEICGMPFHEFVNEQNFRELSELELIAENNDCVYATRKGFVLLNEIIRQLCI